MNYHIHTHMHTHTQKERKKPTTQVKKEKVACTPLFMKFIYFFTHGCRLFIFITIWHSP